jgi:hypothetical protein
MTRSSVFEVAPTKAKALSKLRQHYKALNYTIKKVNSWYGGKPTIYHKGSSMGRNYWFNLTLKDIERR